MLWHQMLCQSPDRQNQLSTQPLATLPPICVCSTQPHLISSPEWPSPNDHPHWHNTWHQHDPPVSLVPEGPLPRNWEVLPLRLTWMSWLLCWLQWTCWSCFDLCHSWPCNFNYPLLFWSLISWQCQWTQSLRKQLGRWQRPWNYLLCNWSFHWRQ